MTDPRVDELLKHVVNETFDDPKRTSEVARVLEDFVHEKATGISIQVEFRSARSESSGARNINQVSDIAELIACDIKPAVWHMWLIVTIRCNAMPIQIEILMEAWQRLTQIPTDA